MHIEAEENPCFKKNSLGWYLLLIYCFNGKGSKHLDNLIIWLFTSDGLFYTLVNFEIASAHAHI